MHSRKGFFALAGTGAAGVLAGCGGDDDDEREARAAADLEIVRYVLQLERVEVAFWEQADQRGNLRDVGAGDLAASIVRNERQHVEVLERWSRRLEGDGGDPERTDFGAVFAAGPQEVLRTGATLENLAAAAYLGQLNRIQDSNLLASMLGIHSVEGRQAAAVNRLAGRGFSLGTGQLEGALPDGAFAQPMSMADVRRQLRRYLA
jgi:Ferritin-like domain